MSFCLTNFIHPLKSSIAISEYVGISFDNPRTEEEVALIAEYIRSSYESASLLKFSPYFDNEEENEKYITLDGIISNLFKKYSSETYESELFRSYDRENIYEFMAKIWVIARFDDEGSRQELIEQYDSIEKEEDTGYLTILEDNHPLVKNENLLNSYSYLLSLLTYINDEEYFGESFIIAGYDEIHDGFPHRHIPRYFLHLISLKVNFDQIESLSKDQSYFPATVERILKISKQLDSLLKTREKEKIEYISSLLRTASSDIDDEKHKLVVLVSIIELLLTHNPNFNRFNIEDSISKQFQLKASILIYANNKDVDIKSIQKRLKIIYAQRSNIAHGNFSELNKYLKNLSKKDGEEEYFSDLIYDLYQYIKAIINEYIKDPNYINFLKEN